MPNFIFSYSFNILQHYIISQKIRNLNLFAEIYDLNNPSGFWILSGITCFYQFFNFLSKIKQLRKVPLYSIIKDVGIH